MLHWRNSRSWSLAFLWSRFRFNHTERSSTSLVAIGECALCFNVAMPLLTLSSRESVHEVHTASNTAKNVFLAYAYALSFQHDLPTCICSDAPHQPKLTALSCSTVVRVLFISFSSQRMDASFALLITSLFSQHIFTLYWRNKLLYDQSTYHKTATALISHLFCF